MRWPWSKSHPLQLQRGDGVVEILRPQPGDVLVARIPVMVSGEAERNVKRQIERVLRAAGHTDIPVAVLSGNISLACVRREVSEPLPRRRKAAP